MASRCALARSARATMGIVYPNEVVSAGTKSVVPGSVSGPPFFLDTTGRLSQIHRQCPKREVGVAS